MTRAFIEDIGESRFTEATLQRMYRLVDAGKTDPAFQKLVRDVINEALPGQWKNYRAEAQVILRWVKNAVNYRRDPVNVELLQDVWRTLGTQAGDCDDFSVLLGAALESIGTPIQFITVSTRADRTPSHVYIEAFLDGRWTPIDGIVKSSSVGWAPRAGITDRRVWTRQDVGLSGYDESSVEGLGMNDWTDDGIHAVRNHGVDQISHTRANPMPGQTIISPRRTPSDRVSRLQDPTKTQLPGGEDRYSVRRVIQSHATPEELHRMQVPWSPDQLEFSERALVGPIPTWKTNPNAILPRPRTEADHDLVDLSGLGMGGLGAGIRRVTRRRMAKKCKCGTTLEGLGIVTDVDGAAIAQDAPRLAAAVTGAVQSGDVPNQPSTISQAIDLAVNLWSAKQTLDATKRAAAPTPAPTPVVRAQAAAAQPSEASKWIVPGAIAATVLVAAAVMLR